MAEQPALNRFYVASYAANDKDFPVLAVRLDPRVAGYRVPEDLSPHPDSKRYPNHVFTGSQPSNGDERVTHIYEILPAPWVPFTRYDDDLGPIQGRRRAVKNEGQQASLASNKKVSYEGREGSAIVSLEIEETWSIETDEDGNSLFPIKTRDFYDASRGPVQETRQLFVPIGEEQGSLENIDGVITQTSYEPYNEYLSIKIVQTYSVDGPKLIGQTTNNEGQLLTITTQRKAAVGYLPPTLSATRTVEASREDLESLIERVVDAPSVFDRLSFSAQKPDTIPEKFRVNSPLKRTESVVEQLTAQQPVLSDTEYSKTEERLTDFTVQKSTTEREDNFNEVQNNRLEENWGINLPYREYISESIPTSPTTEVEGLDDTYHLVREYDADQLDSILSSFSVTIPTSVDLDLPKVLTNVYVSWQASKSLTENTFDGTGAQGQFTSISQQDDGTIESTLSLSPEITFNFKDIWGKNLPATTHIFFLKKDNLTNSSIRSKAGAGANWPVFKPRSHSFIVYGKSERKSFQAYISRAIELNSTEVGYGYQPAKGSRSTIESTLNPISINIPPCISTGFSVQLYNFLEMENNKKIELKYEGITASLDDGRVIDFPEYVNEVPLTHRIEVSGGFSIPLTPPVIPAGGIWLINSSAEPYKFGWFLVRATTLNASVLS